MWVYMCTCACLYAYVTVHVYVCLRVSLYLCAFACICVSMCIYRCMHEHKHLHKYVRMNACTYEISRVFYVCVAHVCMHVCMRMHGSRLCNIPTTYILYIALHYFTCACSTTCMHTYVA